MKTVEVKKQNSLVATAIGIGSAVVLGASLIYAFSGPSWTPRVHQTVALPCEQDWRFDCTETMTEVPLEQQMARVQSKIDTLQYQINELRSLPTTKKEKEAADKAAATKMEFLSSRSIATSGTITIYPSYYPSYPIH